MKHVFIEENLGPSSSILHLTSSKIIGPLMRRGGGTGTELEEGMRSRRPSRVGLSCLIKITDYRYRLLNSSFMYDELDCIFQNHSLLNT